MEQRQFHLIGREPWFRSAHSIHSTRTVLLLLMVTVSASSVGLTQLSYGQYPPRNVYDEQAASRYQNSGYVDLYNRSMEAYKAGHLSDAIDLLERALPQTPPQSLAAAYNNLAVFYIKRANYFTTKQQHNSALGDMLSAYYLLEPGWPEGLQKSPNQVDNTNLARQNVLNVYRNMGINAQDKAGHLERAKSFRMKGQFKPALAEYFWLHQMVPSDGDALLALGDLFVALNDPQKAKRFYEKALPLLGNDVSDSVLQRLGNAQRRAGDVDGAVKTLNKVLEKNPRNVGAQNLLEQIWGHEVQVNPTSVPAHANLAAIFQKKGDFKRALHHYTTAEQFANVKIRQGQLSGDILKQIRLNQGTAYQDMKDYAMAEKAYDSVLQLDPNHVEATFYKASLKKAMGQTRDAIPLYKKVLALKPDYQRAHEDLMDMMLSHPDPRQVQGDLEGYARQFPNNADIQTRVAEYFHEKKDLDRAITYYRAAMQSKPQDAGLHANLGAALNEKGDTQAALAEFKKAAELDPTNDQFKTIESDLVGSLGYEAFSKAVALQQEGKVRESLPHFESALQSAPDNTDMRLAYGVALQQDQQYDRALNEYNRVLQAEPNRAEVHYYVGTIHHQKQDWAKAQAAYEKTLSLQADHAEASQALASIQDTQAQLKLNEAVTAYQQQQYPKALKLINEALAVNKTDGTAHYYKGLIYSGQKKPADAIRSYKDAIYHQPDFVDAYYALAVAYDETNNVSGAKTAFQQYIDKMKASGEPDNDFVTYAKERVKQL